MAYKLIYLEEHSEPYKNDTWVELIGAGHYAIRQSRGDKKSEALIYLTRRQIELILKEVEIKE